MKTIDRNDTAQRNNLPNSQELDPVPEDSFMWIGEESENFTKLQLSELVVNRDRQSKTLYHQILFTILPFILIPLVGIGVGVVTKKIAQSQHPEQVEIGERVNEEGNWIGDLLILLSLGSIELGLALWLASRISHSFNQIAAKLSEATNGNFTAQLEVGDTAEFQEVAENFNQLITKFNRTLEQQRLAAQANKLCLQRGDRDPPNPECRSSINLSLQSRSEWGDGGRISRIWLCADALNTNWKHRFRHITIII
jgi:methyl-accepting chemotaxis protein